MREMQQRFEKGERRVTHEEKSKATVWARRQNAKLPDESAGDHMESRQQQGTQDVPGEQRRCGCSWAQVCHECLQENVCEHHSDSHVEFAVGRRRQEDARHSGHCY